MAVVLDAGKMRLDLRDVQRHLQNKLHHTKWPLVLVYMDSLPKSATNKILRVDFAKRAAIPETHVYTRHWEALFEAVAPPPGARSHTHTHTQSSPPPGRFASAGHETPRSRALLHMLSSRPAPSRGSTGLAGVSTRPAGLPHPLGAVSCTREAAPSTYLLSS